MLRTLIRFYRRRLSGRGPLARVSCSFTHTESCSSYGLRVSEDRPAPVAVWHILGRLRRCRSHALFRTSSGPLWGPAYDAEPLQHDKRLEAAHEQETTRAAVLRGFGAIARECGQPGHARTAALAARALDPSGAAQPLLRNGNTLLSGLSARLLSRLATRVALLAVVALLAANGLAMVVAGPLWALLGLSTALTLGSHHRRVARFQGLLATHAFRIPGAQPARIASATRMPSSALETMPPEYPAPSPVGYRPATETDWQSAPRRIRTGDDVVVSDATRTASSVR